MTFSFFYLVVYLLSDCNFKAHGAQQYEEFRENVILRISRFHVNQTKMVMLNAKYQPIKFVIWALLLILFEVIYETKGIKHWKFLNHTLSKYHHNHHHIKIHLIMISHNYLQIIIATNRIFIEHFQTIAINNSSKNLFFLARMKYGIIIDSLVRFLNISNTEIHDSIHWKKKKWSILYI